MAHAASGGHDHADGLGSSALGCLEASLAVLFTIAFGSLTARTGFMSSSLARDMTKLGSRVLLPALIVTSIGAHLDAHELHELVPLLAWAIFFIGLGFACVDRCPSRTDFAVWATSVTGCSNFLRGRFPPADCVSAQSAPTG